MSWIPFLSGVRDVVLYGATALGVFAIGYYTKVARWWALPEGRFLMAWMTWATVIMVFLTLRVATVLNQTEPLSLASGITVYFWFGCNAIWSIRLVSGAQWANLKDKAIRRIVSRKAPKSD